MSDDPIKQYLTDEIYEYYVSASDEDVAKIITLGYTMREYAKTGKTRFEIAPIRGALGEDYVMNILKPHFNAEYTRHDAKSADIIVDKSIMVEVKNYTRAVPTTEVEKFRRDLGAGSALGGVFISLGSSIARKKTFEYTVEAVRGGTIPVIYISTDVSEVILLAIEMIMAVIKTEHINEDKLVEYIAEISDSVKTLSMIRTNLCEMNNMIHKNLNNISTQLLGAELNLKNNIESIKSKINYSVEVSEIDFVDIISKYHIVNEDYFKHLSKWLLIAPIKMSSRDVECDRGGFRFLKTKMQIFINIPDDPIIAERIFKFVDYKKMTIKAGQLWIDITADNITNIENMLDTCMIKSSRVFDVEDL